MIEDIATTATIAVIVVVAIVVVITTYLLTSTFAVLTLVAMDRPLMGSWVLV